MPAARLMSMACKTGHCLHVYAVNNALACAFGFWLILRTYGRTMFQVRGGWSGGAMVLGKLPVPGRPTIWITVGQGPTALAVGAGGGGLDIFTLIYPFFPLSPSLWETVRYRLKYCLKGPLNTNNQPTKIQVRDRAWFVRLYGERIIDSTGSGTMLYLTCTMIFSVDLAHYGVSRAKDWVSVDCGTNNTYTVPQSLDTQIFSLSSKWGKSISTGM